MHSRSCNPQLFRERLHTEVVFIVTKPNWWFVTLKCGELDLWEGISWYRFFGMVGRMVFVTLGHGHLHWLLAFSKHIEQVLIFFLFRVCYSRVILEVLIIFLKLLQCEICHNLPIGAHLLYSEILLFCHLVDLLKTCFDLFSEVLLSSGDSIHSVEHHVNTFHHLVPLRLVILTFLQHVVKQKLGLLGRLDWCRRGTLLMT